MKGLIALVLLQLLIGREAALADSLRLGEHIIRVEMASTPEQRSRGLMHRDHLGDNEGMLFIFPDSRKRTFWMKNTYIPLSVGFFDEDRRLLDIQRLDPPGTVMQVEIPRVVSQYPARYALEVRQGWFADHSVPVGTMFELLPD